MSHPKSENLRGTVIFAESLKRKPLLHPSTYCGEPRGIDRLWVALAAGI
jgi:hypothetical protein